MKTLGLPMPNSGIPHLLKTTLVQPSLCNRANVFCNTYSGWGSSGAAAVLHLAPNIYVVDKWNKAILFCDKRMVENLTLIAGYAFEVSGRRNIFLIIF